MLDPHKRRKVSVHVEGAKPEHAADGIGDGPDTAADRPAENENGTTAPETVSAMNGAAEHLSSANGRADGVDSLANADGHLKSANERAEGGDSLANGDSDTEPVVELLGADDIWRFKRGLEVFASPK